MIDTSDDVDVPHITLQWVLAPLRFPLRYKLRRALLRPNVLHVAAPRVARRAKRGADEGTRTPDLLFTKQLLYQLSYIGMWDGYVFLVCFLGMINQNLEGWGILVIYCSSLRGHKVAVTIQRRGYWPWIATSLALLAMTISHATMVYNPTSPAPSHFASWTGR